MSKNWDYEDDHDWDDDIDYKERGEVYWYGKYYPKDYVDAIYGDNKEQYNNEADENNGGTLGKTWCGISCRRIGIFGIQSCSSDKGQIP